MMWVWDSALRDKVGSLWLAASIDARAVESTIYRKKTESKTKQRRLNGQSTH